MHFHDIDSLENNAAWKEIKQTLEETRIGLYDDLLNTPADSVAYIGEIQGRIKILDFVLALPADMRMEIEQEEQYRRKINKLEDEEEDDG